MMAEEYEEVRADSEAEDVVLGMSPNPMSPTRRNAHKTLASLEHQPPVPTPESPSTTPTAGKGPRRASRSPNDERFRPGWQLTYEVLYVTSTRHGQQINLAIMVCTIVSVTVAVLDSVRSIRESFDQTLLFLEIVFTLLFTAEYVLRLLCLRCPREYAKSPLGVVDLVSILPTYLVVFVPTARPLVHLAVLRIFRILRVFRILKLARFMEAAATLADNIHTNKRRIAVFLCATATMILVIGCAMYLIEGERHGYSNIPVSMYWTVVTMTTVGYGDMTPQTVPGKLLATLVMFAGYGLIACPMVLNTGPTSSASLTDMGFRVAQCPTPGCAPFMNLHQEDAKFCRRCGHKLRG